MPPNNLTKDEQREVFKEAIREWMNEQFAAFGKWTLGSVLATAFAGAIYLALVGLGMHRP